MSDAIGPGDVAARKATAGDLAAQRERVRRRFAELGETVDREVERAASLKDAVLVVAGAVGFLLTARKLAKALGGRRKRRRSKKLRG